MQQAVDSPGPLAGGLSTHEQYIDAQELARLLGTTTAAVRHWARLGLIPCHVLRHEGRRCYFFLVSELRTCLSLLALEGGPKGPETVPSTDFECPATGEPSTVSIQ